ncbi:hypothetical protein LEP1GSC061_1397 [Leptospira wolffii serovar Khorat str. Khorat-H2]|nr:hypothetical protein LEP1GSC061_1397 [Leptospira wolffii serovar Khorat str. Khorat-H2]
MIFILIPLKILDTFPSFYHKKKGKATESFSSITLPSDPPYLFCSENLIFKNSKSVRIKLW